MKQIWRVEFERQQTAVLYVMAEDPEDAEDDARELVSSADYENDFTPEVHVGRSLHPGRSEVWTGGPDGDWVSGSQAMALTHERYQRAWDLPDPESPPIPCREVEPTDGRRTWRAMGEDVRSLGDEWERRCDYFEGGDLWLAHDHRLAESRAVYLIRRTTPPAPRTERVKWWEAVTDGRVVLASSGYEMDCSNDAIAYYDRKAQRWVLMYDDASHAADDRPVADADGTVEVLTEDGDR